LFQAVQSCTFTNKIESYKNCINILLMEEADINYENKERKTVLMAAASNGFYEIIEELLADERNIYINNVDIDQRNALHYAVDRDQENLDVVNLLVEKGVDLDKPTVNDGLTPLMMAVERNHLKIVNLLLERGARIDLTMTTTLDTVIHLACENGNLEILRWLSANESFYKLLRKKNKQMQTAMDIVEEKIQKNQEGNQVMVGRFNEIHEFLTEFINQAKEKARVQKA
jgi:ankyrin repeat protein